MDERLPAHDNDCGSTSTTTVADARRRSPVRSRTTPRRTAAARRGCSVLMRTWLRHRSRRRKSGAGPEQDVSVEGGLDRGPDGPKNAVGHISGGGRGQHAYHPPEGRIAERAAALELAVEELGHGVPRGEYDRSQLGVPGLDDHPPTGIAGTPRPAGQLREQREGTLLGAEVRDGERLVGVDRRQPASRPARRGPSRRAASRPVPRPRRSRNRRSVASGSPACAATSASSRTTSSRGKCRWSSASTRVVPAPIWVRSTEPHLGQAFGIGFRGAAVVAAQAAAVQGERDVAATAPPGLRACPAVDGRGGSAPVLEDDGAAAAVLDLTESVEQRPRQWVAAVQTQVDDVDRWAGARRPAPAG